MTPAWHPIPFGREDLDCRVKPVDGSRIQCCVRGCQEVLLRARRGARFDSGTYCVAHGIQVSASGTYIYKDNRRNFIVDAERVGGLNKVENWRLGNEKSEDALTWNVFVGFLRLGLLPKLVELIAGVTPSHEVELFLWGNQVTAQSTSPWEELLRVREDLGEARNRFPTEPDVALRCPAEALILVEAKFGSPNSTLEKKLDQYDDPTEFLGRYFVEEGMPDPLNRQWIEQQQPAAVLEQLCRNAIFAQRLAGPGERPLLRNLVRASDEPDVVARFRPHLSPDAPPDFFDRLTWEQLYSLLPPDSASAPLRKYLEQKTYGLERAFQLG